MTAEGLAKLEEELKQLKAEERPAVIRAISDNANEHAAHDFMGFVKTVAAQYAFHITRRLCRDLAAAPL